MEPGQPRGEMSSQTSTPAQGLRIRRFVGPAVYFLGLAIAATWPLFLHMSNEIVGQYGDNLYFIWLIGWTKHALLDLHVSPLFTTMLNYPQGWYLASTELSPAQVLPALPFSAAGPVFGYNLVAIASFVLSGLIPCLWVTHRTQDVWAGVIAGTAFAFVPYRFSHFLVGHLNLMGTQWLVLYFMALSLVLDRRQASVAWCVATAASLALVGLTSMYYLYMAVVLTVFFVLGYVLLVVPGSLRQRWLWRRLAVTFGLALPLVSVVVLPSLVAARAGTLPMRASGFSSPYSASPTDYLLPFTGHPLWGAWVGAHFERDYWIEASLYLGVVASALALVAVVVGVRKRGDRRATLHLLGMALVSFVLSLGLTLNWLSRPVSLHLPPWLTWLKSPDGQLLLPGALLYRYLPFYSSMRVWMRYGVFANLFVDVLAGSGAAWLIRRSGPKLRHFVAVFLLGLVILDFLPPRIRLTEVAARPVDRWIGQQQEEGGVAQLPFAEAAHSQAQIYYTLTRGRPYIGALYGSFPTSQYAEVRPVLERFPSAESIALLRDLGVRYVIVDAEWFDSRDELDDVHIALTRQRYRRTVALAGQYVYVLE